MADAPPLALEPYATLRAEIDAGEELLTVIDREKVTETTWAAAQAFWLKKMAEEAESKRFETTNRYQALYVAKKKIFEGKIARRKAKEERPPIQEPKVAALDEAAKILAASALTEVPAIVVPKAPPVEQIVSAPTFELPPPMVRPPAPVIAAPARVGPAVEGGAAARTAAAATMASAAGSHLPFAPAPPGAIAPPAFVGAPRDRDEEKEPETVRPPGDGSTMAVDIHKLLAEAKLGGTPFAATPAAGAAPPPSAPPPRNPSLLSTVSVNLADLKSSATPFAGSSVGSSAAAPARTDATPFAASSAASALAASAPAAPARMDATPFARAGSTDASVGLPTPLVPPPSERVLESLEADDDEAPRTMMLSEETAKALSKDIPMSARGAALAIATGAGRASPTRSGELIGGEETLPPQTAVPALRDPNIGRDMSAGLPFQRGPGRQSSPNIAIPTMAGAIQPPPSAPPPPVNAPPITAIPPTVALPPAASPSVVPAPAPAASGRADAKIFSLNQFASLTAEIAVHPERIAEIRQRYGVTEALHHAESQRWTEEFAASSELRQRYFGLVQTYREYLQKQKA